MTDADFELNLLNICKCYSSNLVEGMNWINKYEMYIDNDFKRAFFEGARDYLQVLNGFISFKIREEYRLPEVTYNPGYEPYITNARKAELLKAAVPTWLAYNVVTEGLVKLN